MLYWGSVVGGAKRASNYCTDDYEDYATDSRSCTCSVDEPTGEVTGFWHSNGVRMRCIPERKQGVHVGRVLCCLDDRCSPSQPYGSAS